MTASRYNFPMEDRLLKGKEKMRKLLASLSFSEKIKILEKLRDRERAIAAAGLRRKQTQENSGKAANNSKCGEGSFV